MNALGGEQRNVPSRPLNGGVVVGSGTADFGIAIDATTGRRLKSWPALWGGLLALVLVVAADGCSSSAGMAGGERQACYANGTCNAGLVCLSQICVRRNSPDASGTGGAAGTGGGQAGGGGSSDGPGTGGGGAGGAAGIGGGQAGGGGRPNGPGTGGVDGGATVDAGVACSPEAVTATEPLAGQALQHHLENAGAYCLPEQTSNAASGTLSVCTTAACASTANTCAATLTLTTFAYAPATLSFMATADVVVNGGVAGTQVGVPVSCDDLTITAPGTIVTGTLVPMIQTADGGLPPSNVLYTVTNVAVTTSSLGGSGCGVLGALLSLVANTMKSTIEQRTASWVQGMTFTLPCAGSGGSGGGGAGGAASS